MTELELKKIAEQLSTRTSVIDIGDAWCLFDSVSLKKIYVSKKTRLKPERILSVLRKNGYLKNILAKKASLATAIKKQHAPRVKQLYLIVTERCNFRCSYCRQVTHGADRRSSMTRQEARYALDKFIRESGRQPQGVVFYGGEPLLNKAVVTFAIKYLREYERRSKLRPALDLTIITNGTMVDIETAKLFKKYGVYVIISLDGRESEHNMFRTYASGKGTFQDVLRGYRIYRRVGCRIGLSCTIGQHNYQQLNEIFSYFTNNLHPVNIGINLPHDDMNNPLNTRLDAKDVCRNLMEIFQQSDKSKLYIEHIMRKLRLLFNQEIKVNDCPACGGRLVAMPDGYWGICEGAIGNRKFFFPGIEGAKRLSREWYFSSPFFDPACHGCMSLGICGGGCPYDGYLLGKKIGHRDARRCYFMNQIVRWGLREYYRSHRADIRKLGYLVANRRLQREFLSKISGHQKSLPLRSSANYGVIKI